MPGPMTDHELRSRNHLSIIQDRHRDDGVPRGLITPWSDSMVSAIDSERIASYGLGPFGYDVRLGAEFKWISPALRAERLWGSRLNPIELNARIVESNQAMSEFAVDPLDVDPDDYRTHLVNTDENGRGRIILDQGCFYLAHTLEWVKVPDDCVALVCDKSTYARAGIALQNTVLEPGWEGQVTLEITNHGNVPVKLRVGEGIAQIIFFRGERSELPYNARNAGKGGKYQNQTGATLPR